MKNNKTTKRALLSSVLALVLCFSMLLGTTFAWFTDTAVSGNNIIKTGNLDMKLSYKPYGATNTTWTEVDENTVLFGKDALYEPGYTEAIWLKVENIGSLAFRYDLAINISDEKSGTNVDGDEFNLSDYLVINYMSATSTDFESTTCTTRESLLGYNWDTGVASFKNNVAVVQNGIVYSADDATNVDKDVAYALVVISMPTTVGNEANHNGTAVPKIDFTLTALATQLAYEEDSFGDDYDEDANYPLFPAPIEVDASTSFDTFTDIIENGGNIMLTEDITIADSESSRFTNFNLTEDINIYAKDGAKITFAETTTIVGDGTLTVYGGAIDEKQELCVSDNATLVIEGGEHSFAAFSATENGSIIINGGTLNCLGTYAGIMGISFAENGSLVINGGTLNMYQPFNLNANRCDNAYVEINGGEINLLDSTDKLFAVRNIMDKDRVSGVLRGSSIKITGGVFTAAYQMDDTGDANAFIRNEDGPDTTRVLVENTYNGEAQYNCVVTGGTFYGCWTRTGETGGNGTEICENTIEGFVATGYQMVGDATNGYVVTAE